jgi:glycosyltransferase involved in cell wall biosynthesis
MVAADPHDFARAVITLLDDPQRRDAMGAAGRRYVETCHDWDIIAENLEQIYKDAQTAYSNKH